METDVVTVTPETPLLQLHHLFLEEEIHGAPVVDEDGRLLGVISTFDLVRVIQEEYEAERTTPIYQREELTYSSPDWLRYPEDFQDRLSELTVGDAMVTDLVSVPRDAPISEVARLMREHRIHRVLVADGGVLHGIITSFDLLGLVERAEQTASAPH